MQFIEMSFPDAVPVDGYGPGFFRIAGEVREGPLLISASAVKQWGGLDDAALLVSMAGDLDVVLVGTGAEIAPLPRAFREALEAVGLGAEPMSTPSACRTYNVLASEGRRVAAALIPV